MRRRDFLAYLAFSGIPMRAGAQTPTPRVAFIHPGFRAETAPLLLRLKQGISAQIPGLEPEIREYFMRDQGQDLPSLSQNAISEKPDLIVAAGETVKVVARLSGGVPIINLTGGDPISNGTIKSAARPEGTITAVSFISSNLIIKRLEILLELVPGARNILVIQDPNAGQQDASGARNLDSYSTALLQTGVELTRIQLPEPGELNRLLGLVRTPVDAVLLGPSPTFTSQRAVLLENIRRLRKPAIYPLREYVSEGGLMSYGASVADAYEQAGRYAARILAGEPVGHLPVLTPTRFELAVNLPAAAEIGLSLSPSLLARADEVIE